MILRQSLVASAGRVLSASFLSWLLAEDQTRMCFHLLSRKNIVKRSFLEKKFRCILAIFFL